MANVTRGWMKFESGRLGIKSDESDVRKNYFTSSDPHHDMLGGGCQVRVVIKNMMGRMENLRTLISGFLGLVILVRWALVTMFLSWTTQTGCRIHRTYVSLIGSGEGRHTTHLLTFFLTYLLTFFLTNLLVSSTKAISHKHSFCLCAQRLKGWPKWPRAFCSALHTFVCSRGMRWVGKALY